MPRKTRSHKRRSRRKTLKHIRRRRGGSTSQSLKIPSSAFGHNIGAPVNSTDSWYKIA